MFAYKCSKCNIVWKDRRYKMFGLAIMPECPECQSREFVNSGPKKFIGHATITPIPPYYFGISGGV